MYKHLLIPTDGSTRAAKGVKAGVGLARALGAKITGVYAIAPYVPEVYGEAALYVPRASAQESKKFYERQARKALAAILAQAKKAGVRCSTRYVTFGQPWQAILRTARARKCDAIVMASHGRSAVGGLILGSETTRVLAHSKIPVLVIR